MLAHEALSWASYMLGLGALPPDPEYVGDRWRELWLARLRDQPVFLETWLAHQRRDELWRQGSICEDFGALDCGVLLSAAGPMDTPTGWTAPSPAWTRPASRAAGSWGSVEPQLAGGIRARSADRVPAGGGALVGPLAQGR